MSEVVVLRDLVDALGRRHLSASLGNEGDLVIEGQDLGDGVERAFGAGTREYEWAWSVHASDIPALLQALGEDADVLEALRRRFTGNDAAGLKPFLDNCGIPHDVWSRLGD